MKRLIYRHAFTMVELIFIIIVIGILAAVMIPSSQNNRLREAADQISSHIRYTQHLAMMDDKFNPADSNWYKKRWQIFFEQEGDDWIYTIYSDDNTDGNVNEIEIARNPQNPSSRLTGKATMNAASDINLGRKYGIGRNKDSIRFVNCDNNNKRIVFDYLGRPMQGNTTDYTMPYQNTHLITNLCTITIENSAGQTVNITIQPETGFTEVISF
jgi:Tfp pilus assembly protein FimT